MGVFPTKWPANPVRAPTARRSGPEACLLLLLLATFLPAAGCHEGSGFASWMLSRTPSAPAAATAATDADATLAARVEDALLADPALQGELLVADVDHGHVTLRGRLHAPSLRDRALQVAESVPGVVAVDDRLDVRPESASEAESFVPARRSRSGAVR